MKLDELIQEAFAIKLADGKWYTEQQPSLGPLKGGNAQVRKFKTMQAADDFMVMQMNNKGGGKRFVDAEIKRAPK